jgi:hypothetical protein
MMKYLLKRSMAILLAVAVVVGTMPYNAFAANNDLVLSSISYSGAEVTRVGTSVEVTVPYGTTGTLDLTTNLNYTFNDTDYTLVGTPAFSTGSEAAAIGETKTLTIGFTRNDEAPELGPYETTYDIDIVEAAYVAPAFSGTKSKSVTAGNTLSFADTDFDSLYQQNDGADLASIAITGSDIALGSLELPSGTAYVWDTPIDVADISDLKFTAPTSGEVNYDVIAYESPDTLVAGSGATLKITVNPEVITAADIAVSTTQDTPVKFAASSFNSVGLAAASEALISVSFVLPSSSSGVLYENYVSATNTGTAVTTSNINAADLSNVTFVPHTGYTGSVTINYTGTTATKSYTGKVIVSVAAVTVAAVTISTDLNTPVKLVSSSFNTVCQDVTGIALSYVKFTLPSTADGKLYYNYTSATDYDDKVDATTRYYRTSSSADLDNVTYVPYTGDTGIVTINYTGYNTDGDSYNGTLKVTINASVNTTTYSTDLNTPIAFKSTDLNTVSLDATDVALSYVKFTLPSTTYGKLYYDYTSSSVYDSKVDATTKYYRSSTTADIDEVSFVPTTGYTGTVTVSYTGYNTDGESFSGKIKITVGSGTYTTSYTTAIDTPIKFKSTDLNTVCLDATGVALSYVKFTLPSTTYGKLYYDYTSSSVYDSKVDITTKYYKSSTTADIDLVSFVPTTGYSGTVTISYTGYDTAGDTYSGKIKIVVGSGSSSFTYAGTQDLPVLFKSTDFSTACTNATGGTLSYVKFILPSTTTGKLYYSYVSATSFSSAVDAVTKYYKTSSTADIDNVSFVPGAGYVGTATLTYTGYDTDGESFPGTIKITIAAVAPTASLYFKDVNTSYSWAVTAIDYLYKASIVNGTGSGIYSPAAKITRGDFMLMLSRALKLTSSSAVTNFGDVPRDSYYYNAVAVAKALGIAQGSNGNFYPTSAITREDAMVLVYRALQISGKTMPTGTLANLSAYNDRSAVSSYAISAVGSLVSKGLVKGDGLYLNPQNSVTRAEMAVILYRVLMN